MENKVNDQVTKEPKTDVTEKKTRAKKLDKNTFPSVSLPKTKDELNKKKLTLDASAKVEVITQYRKGQQPIIVPNINYSHYVVSINDVSVIVNEKQYNAMFGIKG